VTKDIHTLLEEAGALRAENARLRDAAAEDDTVAVPPETLEILEMQLTEQARQLTAQAAQLKRMREGAARNDRI
jgi:hypothetical protein